MHSHKLLVGSNTIYVYDVILNKLFKMANYKHILSQMGFTNIQGILLYLTDQRLAYV